MPHRGLAECHLIHPAPVPLCRLWLFISCNRKGPKDRAVNLFGNLLQLGDHQNQPVDPAVSL
jgi:hypothetical protein